VNFRHVLGSEVTILPSISFPTNALPKLRLLKQDYYLLCEVSGVLFGPYSRHAIFDQLATGGRGSTNDRFAIRPSFDIGDTERLVCRGKTENITRGQGVGFAKFVRHSEITQ
jgi:hypothetical protein